MLWMCPSFQHLAIAVPILMASPITACICREPFGPISIVYTYRRSVPSFRYQYVRRRKKFPAAFTSSSGVSGSVPLFQERITWASVWSWKLPLRIQRSSSLAFFS